MGFFCRFATPGDDVLTAFTAARPEISALVSAPEGRSARVYEVFMLGQSDSAFPVVVLWITLNISGLFHKGGGIIASRPFSLVSVGFINPPANG